MTNIRALPVGHWVIVRHGGREGAAAWDDPVVPHWRKVRHGKPSAADVAAVQAWLEGADPVAPVQLELLGVVW